MVMHTFHPLKLVARAEWTRALGPDEPALEEAPPDAATLGPPFEPIKRPVRYVVYTMETPSPRCYSHDECVMAMRRLHRLFVGQLGMPDLPFNFLVGHDGSVYEARGWRAQPSHQIPYFRQHTGNRMDIALIGDYSTDVMLYPMSDACLELIEIGIELGIVDRYYDALSAMDLKRVEAFAREEKRDAPWENWQVQQLAEKIFKKEFTYEESAEKMKGIIEKKNMPSNAWCVIM